MKNYLSKATLLAVFFLSFVAMNVSAADYTLHKYAPNNGGILQTVAPDGKWAVINLGTSASGLTCSSELFNMATGDHFVVNINGREISFEAVSNEDADGNVTIVGSMSNRPVAYKFNPKTPDVAGKLILLPNRTNWGTGRLTAVTPDGKYAVGYYTNFTGIDVEGAELNGEFWFDGLYADLEAGVVLDTPGTPVGDRNGNDQHAMKFEAITPDGKFILGEREWYMPTEGFPFIYDVEKQDFNPISFTRQGNRMLPENNIAYLDFPVMSPNGRYIGGTAISYVEVEGSEFASESMKPYRFDRVTGEMTIFDDSESANIGVGCIDDNGTIFGNPETGSPLRNFKIFYQDKYWIPFAQVCQQIYGFNFSQKTGFEFSGTATSVSADGRYLIAFSDPQGESFSFDFGEPVENACSKFDLLSNYTVNPVPGSAFSLLTSVEINFGRAVQVLGTGRNHLHLYKTDGTKVADGLSTTGENGGLHLKAGSSTVVVGTFRNRQLENGEKYYVVLDAGAVAPASDAAMVNKEIRVAYLGRSDAPVKIVKTAPEDGSMLQHLDATSSYVLLTFDCPVKLTDSYDAYVERLEEEGTVTRVATLSLASGSADETRNQILLYPTSQLNLYDGVKYRIVLAAGSVSDNAGTASSYNEEWSMNVTGTYVREIATETTLFFDSFDSPNHSMSLWLNYEGDHNFPLSEQKNWGFDSDNVPWNFSTHDSESDPNYYATSHSLYAPSGQSDDWMMTPQLSIPVDGKTMLEFDAQKYKVNKDDHLWIYVIPESRSIAYLNDANMAVLKKEAVLLDEIKDMSTYTDKAEGNWTHYAYNLEAYAGKDIYIAFVNQNNNQSVVLVDNVSVQREILYTIGFSNDDRMVAQSQTDIKGTFTIKTADFNSGAITLILKTADGNEVSRIEWPSITGTSIKDRPIPMNFPQPLPLTLGKENKFTIDIIFDGKDINGNDYKRNETFIGTIYDLVFEPVKRVVLEEMTGVSCPNCPQGHIAIEACERQYKDQFIPVSIHSYDGDDLGAQFRAYTNDLGLIGAPTARINRIWNVANGGIYFPMLGSASSFVYDSKADDLWYNIVAQELEKLALCEVNTSAEFADEDKKINISADVRYALDAEQQLSVFAVVLEDGIVSYQENNFANSYASGLGEWGLGGIYGTYYAYPVTHNDVVRAAIGQTFSGTIGMLPQSFESDKTYNVSFGCNTPDAILDKNNLSVVVMLIDTQTGEIVNAAKAKVGAEGSGIKDITNDATTGNDAIYNLAGQRITNAKGIVIRNGRKMIVK